MTVYRGNLNIVQDGDNSVIPITLFPTDIPSDGLTIDVASLQQPSGQQFGCISGVTIDATNTNVAASIITLTPLGGYNLIRNVNGGSTQVYQIGGQCQQLIIKNNGWISGSISVVLWNSKPTTEISSPVNVVANIASGNINVQSGNITTTLAPTSSEAGASITATNSSVTVLPDSIGKTYTIVGFHVSMQQFASNAASQACTLLLESSDGTTLLWEAFPQLIANTSVGYAVMATIIGINTMLPLGKGLIVVVSGSTFTSGSFTINVYYRLSP